MPYERLEDLPERVRNVLPHHAEEIYRAAFNNAWDQYRDPEERERGGTREETAHSVAWSAVEREYEKDEMTGEWRRKKDRRVQNKP
jgi:cation transport regulator